MASLSALLAAIDPLRVDVDVYCRSHLGPCRSQLTNCNILKENIWLSSVVRSRGFFVQMISYIVQLAIHLFSVIGINIARSTYLLGGRIIKSNKYDCVIAFQEAVLPFVSYIPAKKKVAWIHCDYERVVKENTKAKEDNCFDRFDRIVCVSNSAKEAFERVFPEYAYKTEYIYNVVDYETIRKKAIDSTPVNSDFLLDRKTIVSVGRFDSIKQFDLIPGIAATIKQLTTVPFRWYIIGATDGGEYETAISNLIKKCNVENEVIVYPAQQGIYPYIASSDILVNTSRSESFSMVVFEARALGVIPVMNDIAVAHEVINNEIDGLIATIEDMPKCIAGLLESDKKWLFKPWDSDNAINKLYKLIEG